MVAAARVAERIYPVRTVGKDGLLPCKTFTTRQVVGHRGPAAPVSTQLHQSQFGEHLPARASTVEGVLEYDQVITVTVVD